jgi:hypothetical protein
MVRVYAVVRLVNLEHLLSGFFLSSRSSPLSDIHGQRGFEQPDVRICWKAIERIACRHHWRRFRVPFNREVVKLSSAGLGIGGLATALSLARRGFKNISVYEAASGLGFVGAGIQLAPNMARILDRLGCWANIEKDAVELKHTNIRGGLSITYIILSLIF